MQPAVINPQDEKLAAIDELCGYLETRLAPDFRVARDNPGRTPPAWSVAAAGKPPAIIFGLIDRTFFWTFDEGVSNHYSKSPELMRAIVLAELTRTRQLVR
jgi:hypothetical protein